MLVAARDAGVRRFVYAASRSTYGDHPGLPKVEDRDRQAAVALRGDQVRQRAVRRRSSAAATASRPIGLRYFNVFGPRQDPDGAYAAVIPKWVATMLDGEPVSINGDGETSRDFCYVDNVVQANLLAAIVDERGRGRRGLQRRGRGAHVAERACAGALRDLPASRAIPTWSCRRRRYQDFRAGDVRHSQADIGKARSLLGYAPTHDVRRGLAEAMPWYETRAMRDRAEAARATSG